MSPVEHYTYRVQWSAEDEAFVGTVAELPSLSWISDSPSEALEGTLRLVRETAEDMIANGEELPEPYAERTFSGKLQLRIPPETHRMLTIEAAEQHVSLNRLISSRLVGAGH